MKEFLIFHSSNHTPGATVERLRRVAKTCAENSGVQLRVMAIDVEAGHPKNRHRQTKRLIECTTVIDDVVDDHHVNPSDVRVCDMISALK